MSKKAIIFHGTGGKPIHCWYPWMGEQLTAKGYAVEIPAYPEINKEPILTFLPKILANHSFDEDTILIGHSAGATLLLSILESIDIIIPQAFLIAGYATLPNISEEPVLQEKYDWKKIKAHIKDIYFINSINDPYGCDEKQGRTLFEHLGGTQIIRDEGHFGSPTQSYRTFELLNTLIV